jgi:outer membrane protein OmpA-like peptidoglycan-associated protein
MNVAGVNLDNRRTGGHEQEDHWIPLSDLMTGLMMLFMLIAVLFMIKVNRDKDRLTVLTAQAQAQAAAEGQRVQAVSRVLRVYDALRDRLYDDLSVEFWNDLPKWGAKLDGDLAIRFNEPDVLFGNGSSVLKPEFIRILDDFFPRYVKILSRPEYKSNIEEVRIEGHTSSIWNSTTVGDAAYFKNMELSQQRTRTTLEHVLTLPAVAFDKAWLISHLTANGLSSSKPRLNLDGTENPAVSQRVEFRVRMDANAQISEIREKHQEVPVR